MVNPKTAILLPSAYRPIHLQECLTSLFNTTPRDKYEIFVSIFRDDRPSMDVISDFDITGVTYRDRAEYELGSIYGWLKLLRSANQYEFYFCAADDLIFHAGWFEAAWRAMRSLDNNGLVGVNDTHSNGNEYAATGLVSRSFLIEHHGGSLCSPKYRSWWCDREITDLAMSLNKYIWAKDSIVEHRNHAWGGIEHDQTYRDAEPNYDSDYQLYRYYKDNGFPIDWEPILLEG